MDANPNLRHNSAMQAWPTKSQDSMPQLLFQFPYSDTRYPVVNVREHPVASPELILFAHVTTIDLSCGRATCGD